MTVSRDAIPVEFPALFRVSRRALSSARCSSPRLIRKGIRSRARSARNLKRSIATMAPALRNSLPHCQKPIQSPVRLTRSVQ
jgi:hypothetical protein